jgi:hypothetical protein
LYIDDHVFMEFGGGVVTGSQGNPGIQNDIKFGSENV